MSTSPARFVLLTLALLVVVHAPAASETGAAADCNPAIQNGRWQGTWDQTYILRATARRNGVPDDWVVSNTFSGQIVLMVACDGSITGQATETVSGNATWTLGLTMTETRSYATLASQVTGSLVPIPGSSIPVISLTFYMDGDGRVSGNVGLGPRYFNINRTIVRTWDITSGLGGDLAGPVSTDTFYEWWRDNTMPAIWQGAGYSVTENETTAWRLRNYGPQILTVNPQYRAFFLAGVSLPNTYNVLVDWKQAPAGTRQLDVSINGNPSTPVAAAGDVVSVQLDMGRDFPASSAAESTITFTARSPDGTSLPYREWAWVSAVPAWAGSASNFSWTPQGSSDVALYFTNMRFPSQPFNISTNIEPEFPVVGGTWGLVGGQATWSPIAASDGAEKLSTLRASPRLQLGNWKQYSIDATGVTTQTLDSQLVMAGGEVRVGPAQWSDEYTLLGLSDLIPTYGVGSVPIIGDDILDALDTLARIKLDVNAGLQAAGRFDDSGDTLAWTGGQATSTVGARVSLKVGVRSLGAWVAGGGQGRLTGRFIPAPPTVTGGDLTLYVAAGINVLKFTKAWCYPWTWRYGSGVSSGGTCPAGATTMSLEMRPRMPANYANFVGGPGVTASQSSSPFASERTIVQQAYREAEPRLAVGSAGQAALAWVHDDPSKPTQQANEIYSSVYDGSAWSTPVALTNDSNQDFAPSVAVDGHGNVMVVWMRHTVAGQPSSVTLDGSFLSALDIWYARYDATAKAWSSPAPVSSDSIFDDSPLLATAKDGSIMVLWVANSANRLMGSQASPDSLMYSTWNGQSWSHPAALATVSNLLFFDAALGGTGSSGTLILARDEDGDLSGSTDREIYTSSWDGASWSPPARATNDAVQDDSPRLTYDSTNTVKFFWRRGGDLVTASGLPTATLTTVARNVPPGVAVASGPENRLAAVWASSVVSGTGLLGMTYDGHSGWSGPRVFSSNGDMHQSPTGGYLPSGDLMLGYGNVPVTLSTVTLTGTQVITNVPTLGSFSDLLVGTYKGLSSGFLPLTFKTFGGGW